MDADLAPILGLKCSILDAVQCEEHYQGDTGCGRGACGTAVAGCMFKK